jgi:pyrimidine operon attenuation protein/uracil phosphoribosyltransferase
MATDRPNRAPLTAQEIVEALDLLRQVARIAKEQIRKADHDLDVLVAGLESTAMDLAQHGVAASRGNGGAS